LKSDSPLLIHNADTAFIANTGWHNEVAEMKCDGAILVFRSHEDRWSYARVDENDNVVEVREKQVISPWATVGAYWFARASQYVTLAEDAINSESTERGEYFVGPLYNHLIAAGGKVKTVLINELLCFGTPKDYLETTTKLANYLSVKDQS
jgi:dTDP-glucose pyrophosphorylase